MQTNSGASWKRGACIKFKKVEQQKEQEKMAGRRGVKFPWKWGKINLQRLTSIQGQYQNYMIPKFRSKIILIFRQKSRTVAQTFTVHYFGSKTLFIKKFPPFAPIDTN